MADKDYISVSEAIVYAKEHVDALPTFCVNGEVTGFRGPNARSGHCYFQLKDASCAVDVIIWRGTYSKLDFALRDGLQVEVRGKFNIYAASGKLSFVISSIHVAGEGLLRQKVAELAKKLEAEGLMEDARKRPIPRFCSRIVVCTSLSGAVIDDVKRTLARRNPLVEIQAVGCVVQGVEAAPTICRALALAEAQKPDAILLVRGGGSFEDLMCFNDETVARAIAASTVPVITGIGHEPDVTIADLVSDRRTSTPTAAAESVAPAIDEVANQIWERKRRLAQSMMQIVLREKTTLDQMQSSMNRQMKTQLSQLKQYVDLVSKRSCLQKPDAFINDKQVQLELTGERLLNAMPRVLDHAHERLDALISRFDLLGERVLSPYQAHYQLLYRSLDNLSPLKSLERGYSIVEDAHARVIKDARELSEGDEISVMLARGSAQAKVLATSDKSRVMAAVRE